MSGPPKNREIELSELGTKVRAGTLMSSLLRAIASEKTELVQYKVPGAKDGKMVTKLVSKAEAIVRDMIQIALPHKIADREDIIDPKVRLDYRKIILDRIDGRAGEINANDKEEGESIPDRVSRINKDYLNIQAKNATKESKKEKNSNPPEL